MIDKQKLLQLADAMDRLAELKLRSQCTVSSDETHLVFWVWCEPGMEDALRRQMIAIVTPLTGVMRQDGDDWRGTGNGFTVYCSQAAACKVVGYKVQKKTVQKEIRRDPEYETVEEEVRVPITDCEIKAGKYTPDDIEVPA